MSQTSHTTSNGFKISLVSSLISNCIYQSPGFHEISDQRQMLLFIEIHNQAKYLAYNSVRIKSLH